MGIKQSIYHQLYGDSLFERRISWTKNVLKRIPQGWRVLDAGAGECRNRQYMRHVEYISQDFCQYDGTHKVGGYLTPSDFTDGKWDVSHIDIVSDIESIPVEDGYFDAIVCTEVFEHLKDPMAALKEFSRILRSGGVLIITAPTSCGVHMAPYFYYSGFSEFWYRFFLEKNGFKIKEITKNGNTFDKIAELTNAADYYVKYYSGKRMNIFERLMMHFAALICIKYSRKTKGSENFYTDNMMLMAIKE